MQVTSLEFKFKGSRKYIQGPDIYNAIMGLNEHLENVKKIRFTAHDFINSSKCVAYLTDDKSELNKIENVRARCLFNINDKPHWVAVVQTTSDINSGERVDYDEDKLISLCNIQEDKIELRQQSPFTFIETIVSMNKHLHQQLFPQAVGKWIFTRIDLDYECKERNQLALHFRHNMNYHLTKSDVLVNNVKIGDIYFSLVKT